MKLLFDTANPMVFLTSWSIGVAVTANEPVQTVAPQHGSPEDTAVNADPALSGQKYQKIPREILQIRRDSLQAIRGTERDMKPF